MLTLLQLINRMIYLEYTRDEVEEHFNALASGSISPFELYGILGLEPQPSAMVQRLMEVLPKRESAISMSFLKAGLE